MEIMEYDVSDSMRRAVTKYETAVYEITGVYPKLYSVDKPFVSEEASGSRQRQPCTSGPSVECPSCYHAMALHHIQHHTLPEGTTRSISQILPRSGDNGYESCTTTDGETDYGDSGTEDSNAKRTNVSQQTHPNMEPGVRGVIFLFAQEENSNPEATQGHINDQPSAGGISPDISSANDKNQDYAKAEMTDASEAREGPSRVAAGARYQAPWHLPESG